MLEIYEIVKFCSSWSICELNTKRIISFRLQLLCRISLVLLHQTQLHEKALLCKDVVDTSTNNCKSIVKYIFREPDELGHFSTKEYPNKKFYPPPWRTRWYHTFFRAKFQGDVISFQQEVSRHAIQFAVANILHVMNDGTEYWFITKV